LVTLFTVNYCNFVLLNIIKEMFTSVVRNVHMNNYMLYFDKRKKIHVFTIQSFDLTCTAIWIDLTWS